MVEVAELGHSSDSGRAVEHVVPNDVWQIWRQVRLLLEARPESWSSYYTIQALFRAVQNGEIQLWAVRAGGALELVVFTEIRDFPKLRVLDVLLCIGRHLAPSVEFMEDVERYARRRGAKKVVGMGREGFLRVLAKRNYRQCVVGFEKNLEN